MINIKDLFEYFGYVVFFYYNIKKIVCIMGDYLNWKINLREVIMIYCIRLY